MIHLISQPEVAYLKDKSKIIKKYFPKDGDFFFPGIWEIEDLGKVILKTITIEEFREKIKDI